jgi:hypothetical protein
VSYQSRAIYGSSGAITNAYGGYDGFTANGPVTNQYGWYTALPTGTGTITNSYGFYCEAMTKGGTLNYAFFSAGTTPSHFGGNVDSGGSILSSSQSGIGYVPGVGTGGSVTQLTSRSTGVTLNKITGAIVLVSAAGSTTPTTFTVTNSSVIATDVVIVNQKSGTDKYEIFVTALPGGSFNITFFTTGGTTTETPVFNFTVIKSANT